MSFCEFYYVRIKKRVNTDVLADLEGQKHGIYVVLCTWHQKPRYIYSVVGTPTSENTGIYAVLSMWQDDFVHAKVTETQFKGSLEVKLPTIWTDGKSRGGKSQRRERKKKEDQRRERQKKEDPGTRKGRKVAKHPVFPMFCGSRGSKSRLAKAAGAEPSGQMRDRAKQTSGP